MAQQIQPIYRTFLALGLSLVYGLGGSAIRFSTEGANLIFGAHVHPAFKADLQPDLIFSNTAFLLALLWVTPGMRMTRRLRVLMLGAGLLYITHVGALATKVEYSLSEMKHPLASANPFLWENLDHFFGWIGKLFFPIAIWLLLSMRYMTGLMDLRRPESRPSQPGRNDPCNCGSGKKYKYCCGRN